MSLAVSAAHDNAPIPTSIASFKAFLVLLKRCDGRRRRQKGCNGYDQKSLHRAGWLKSCVEASATGTGRRARANRLPSLGRCRRIQRAQRRAPSRLAAQPWPHHIASKSFPRAIGDGPALLQAERLQRRQPRKLPGKQPRKWWQKSLPHGRQSKRGRARYPRAKHKPSGKQASNAPAARTAWRLAPRSASPC